MAFAIAGTYLVAPRDRWTAIPTLKGNSPPSQRYQIGRSRTRWSMAAEEHEDQSKWPPPDQIFVRFINIPNREDVFASAKLGEILLAVGDSAGVMIPRGCRSGVCGSCTSDIVDVNSDSGVQVVRACQTGVLLPDGYSELIVDLHRMRDVTEARASDPMARFDNLDTDYVAGAAPRRKGATRKIDCARCTASGDVMCYGCDGTGVEAEDTSYACQLCVGTGMLRCPKCQGTGSVMS